MGPRVVVLTFPDIINPILRERLRHNNKPTWFDPLHFCSEKSKEVGGDDQSFLDEAITHQVDRQE